MKLCVICSNCKQEIPARVKAPDRGKLKIKRGPEVKVECLKCGHRKLYEINKIFAKSSALYLLMGFLIGIGLTVLLVLFLPSFRFNHKLTYAISSAPGVIFMTLVISQQRKLRMFNGYRV